MRTGAVKYLKELGWDVTVVMPNYENQEFKMEDNIWQIPFAHSIKFDSKKRLYLKYCTFLEKIGYYEDYLDLWVKNAYNYLLPYIKSNDVLFSTCGGELGMIKLGSLLQKRIKCKFVVNFRDPPNHGFSGDLILGSSFHVDRSNIQAKYIENADLIIVSSKSYSALLKLKFRSLKDKIYNNYFGFLNEIDLSGLKKKNSEKIRIAYSGMIGPAQRPENIYWLIKELGLKNIELYYIGNISKLKIKKDNDSFLKVMDFMPHEEYLKFMIENIDIGFVSLAQEYYGLCVPSKIYEYINLGIPILGFLPDGDAVEMINRNNFGIASHYNDKESQKRSLLDVCDRRNISSMKQKILLKKREWAMSERIKGVDTLLRSIL